MQATRLGPGPASPTFKPSASSTFKNLTRSWRFEYSGPEPSFINFAAGYAAKDTIRIGDPGTGLSVPKGVFGVATSSKGFPSDFSEGIFGLSHDGSVTGLGVPPVVIQAIKKDHALAENLFGVRLNRAEDANPRPPTPTNSAGDAVRTNAGKIVLGGVDKSQFKGKVTYVPTQPRKEFWQIAIDGIYVNNKLIGGTKGFDSILDTGTSSIVLPPALAAEFYKPLNGVPDPTVSFPGVYQVPSNTIIDVKVKIGGKFFPIKAQDLFSGYTNSSRTHVYGNLFGINATNASPNGTYPSNATEVIVLGGPLLLNYYSIFDFNGRIGLAELAEPGKLPAVGPIDIAARNRSLPANHVGRVSAGGKFAPLRSARVS